MKKAELSHIHIEVGDEGAALGFLQLLCQGPRWVDYRIGGATLPRVSLSRLADVVLGPVSPKESLWQENLNLFAVRLGRVR